MALFGSGRDASFLRGINKELINEYIDTEVAIYKLSLEDTKANIYGESSNKYYFDPVRVPTIIDSSAKGNEVSDTGLNETRDISFAFVRVTLEEIPLVLEKGDVIHWDEEYYTVDIVKDEQYWGEKNPPTHIGNVQEEINEHGYSVSVIAECHLSRATKLNLVHERTGTADVPIKRNVERKRSIYD